MKSTFITAVILLFTTFSFASENSKNSINDTKSINYAKSISDTKSINYTNSVNIDSLIRSEISLKYKGAVIIEIEKENGNIEVEIIHEQKEKNVIFNSQGEWQSTKYDISKTELPTNIKDAIANSKYSSYNIDDIEVIKTPTTSMYEVKLDKWFSSDEKTIYITFDGKII